MIGTWNVRTLRDNEHNQCPERKTGLIARELARYNIDIAAISETHLSDSGELCEQLGGYTYYWSGKPASEKAESGVGFAIRNNLVRSLTELPKGISDRIITLRLQLTSKKYLHLISAYAPTLPSPDEEKNRFYQELRNVLQEIPSADKILLLGDFNARVGGDFNAWNGVIGRHGIGKCNSNGLHLLTLCAEFDLCLTNTCFRLPEKYKTTWMHPRSKHWHLLDYVIVRKKDLADVLITRAMRGAQGWTDHRLVRSRLNITLKAPRRASHKIPTKLSCKILVHDRVTRMKLDDAFGADGSLVTEPASVDEQWDTYATKLRGCALEVLGKPQKKNQDWFDDSDVEIRKLVNDFRASLRSHDANRRKAAHYNLKVQVRALKDKWWVDKANEMQLYADTNQIGRFFECLKTIFGPKSRKIAPIYDKDKICRLTQECDILARWAEHFKEVLNPEHQSTDIPYIETLADLPTDELLANAPSYAEFTAALDKLKNGKTAGLDNLPSELYKYGGPHIKSSLFALILKIWECEKIPQDWKDASICKLYKGKGDISDCSSHRGISLLSAAGKVLAHIINNRLIHLAEKLLPETQCGFRPNRGTVDAIFVVKQIQEKSLEQHQPLFMCFVDLEKAFDRVPREALWIVLKKTGCPDKIVNLIRQFHDNMLAKIRHEDKLSEQFPVTCGVKQGCVLAPTLFSFYFAAVMNDATKACSGQIGLNSRTDKSVFNITRLRTKSRVNKLSILEILYADDVCMMANSAETLQTYMNLLNDSCRRFGLVISSTKTQVLQQPLRGLNADDYIIELDNKPLEIVSHFKYLGSQIRSDNSLTTEIAARIAKAASAFGKLNDRVWKSHDLKLQTKIAVYKAVVLSILLYSSETWCCYKADIRKLDTFHLRCLRTILRIKWEDHVPNTEILRRVKLPGIEALIMKHQLRWSGHIVRMDDSRLPKAVLYSELSCGKRRQGGQHLRYKDIIRRHLTACGIPSDRWEELALHRSEWRSTVHKSVEQFEQTRLMNLDVKRVSRKAQPKPVYMYTYNPAGQLYCAPCGRVFKAKFGFASHIRAYHNMDTDN